MTPPRPARKAVRILLRATGWWRQDLLEGLLARSGIQDARLDLVRAIAGAALDRMGPQAVAWGDRAVSELVAGACQDFGIDAQVNEGRVTIDGVDYPHTWVSFAGGGMLDLMPVGHWWITKTHREMIPEATTKTESIDPGEIERLVQTVRQQLGIPAVAVLLDPSLPIQAMPAAGSPLYHGCDGETARKIAADGFVRWMGGEAPKGKAPALRPMQDRTYWSADPAFAMHHALGAHWPSMRNDRDHTNAEGGLVIADAADFDQALPDEDWVGAQILSCAARYVRENFPNRRDVSYVPAEEPTEAARTVYRFLPSALRERADRNAGRVGEVAAEAVLGKAINRWLAKTSGAARWLRALVEAAPEVAMAGEVPVREVLVFDPHVVEPDVSNLREVATSLPIGAGADIQAAAVQLAAERRLYWHGTSDVFAEAILSQGLAQGDQRVWPGGSDMPSMNGQYLSDRVSVAVGAAGQAVLKMGGQPLIVGVTFESRDPAVVLDEDHFLFPMVPHGVPMDDPAAVSDVVDAYLADLAQGYPGVDPRRLEAMRPAVERYVRAFPDRKEPEGAQAFEQANDDLIRASRWMVEYDTRERTSREHTRTEQPNVRVTEPITYRGSKRIVLVAQLSKGPSGIQVEPLWQSTDGLNPQADDPIDVLRRELRSVRPSTLRFTFGAARAPADSRLLAAIQALLPEMAAAAQDVYDRWEQDEDGEDPELGTGGICDRVDFAVGAVLESNIPNIATADGSPEGEDHAWSLVTDGVEVYAVDLPAHVYETGYGYTWTKRPDIVIHPGDFVIDYLGPFQEWEEVFDNLDADTSGLIAHRADARVQVMNVSAPAGTLTAATEDEGHPPWLRRILLSLPIDRGGDCGQEGGYLVDLRGELFVLRLESWTSDCVPGAEDPAAAALESARAMAAQWNEEGWPQTGVEEFDGEPYVVTWALDHARDEEREALGEPIEVTGARAEDDEIVWFNTDDPKTPREIVTAIRSGWEVYNAPRPMLGTKAIDDGPSRSGTFYGLIDPTDPFADQFRQRDLDHGGWPVRLTSNAEILEEARAHLEQKYPDALPEFEEAIASGDDREIRMYLGGFRNKPWVSGLRRGGALEFERNEDGSYEGDLPDFDVALKKPEPVEVAEMDDSFKVETLEGWVEGDPGDFLVRGPGGEMWPINREVFEDTYVDPASLDEDEKREIVDRLEEVLDGDAEVERQAALVITADEASDLEELDGIDGALKHAPGNRNHLDEMWRYVQTGDWASVQGLAQELGYEFDDDETVTYARMTREPDDILGDFYRVWVATARADGQADRVLTAWVPHPPASDGGGWVAEARAHIQAKYPDALPDLEEAIASGDDRAISMYLGSLRNKPWVSLTRRAAADDAFATGDPPVVPEPDEPVATRPPRTREEVFHRFVTEAVPHVWRNGDRLVSVIELDEERPSKGILAAVACRGPSSAIGDIVFRRSERYGLRLADDLLQRDDDYIWRILVHEAVHLGIQNHGRAFRDLCREKGGAVSEYANDSMGLVHVERKDGPRYKPIRDFNDEDEAMRWMREERSRTPGKYRITMSKDPLPADGAFDIQAADTTRVDAASDWIEEIRRTRTAAHADFLSVYQAQVEFRSGDARKGWAFVIPDASEPGQWRVQRFDESGFFGHYTRATEEQARDEMFDVLWGRDDDRVVPDPGALRRLSGTPEWEDGMERVRQIQKLNEEGWARQLELESGGTPVEAELELVGYRQIRFIRPRGLPNHVFDDLVQGDTSELTPAGDTRVDSPFGGGRKLTTEGEDEVHVADPVGTLRAIIQSGRPVELEWQDGVLNVVDGYADRFRIRLDPGKSTIASLRGHVVEVQTEIGSTSMSPSFRGLVRDLATVDPSLRFTTTEHRTRLPADQFLAQFVQPDAAVGKGTLVLWHGTTSRFYYQAEAGELDPTVLGTPIRPIQRFGLQPPASTGATNWIGPEGSPHDQSYASFVYLATDQAHAEVYARRATLVYGGRSIVLRVTVPDVSKLVPDDDYIMSLDEQGAGRDPTALESLTRYGQVAYAGRIPATFVQVVWEGDPPFRPTPGAAERVPLFRELYVLQGAATGAIAGVMDLYQRDLQIGRFRGLLHQNAIDNSKMEPWEDFGRALDELLYRLSWIGSKDGKPSRVVKAADAATESASAGAELMRAIDPYVRDLERILERNAPGLETAWFPGEARVKWLFDALDEIRDEQIEDRVYALANEGSIDEEWPYSAKRRDAYNAASEWWNAHERAIDALREGGVEVWDSASVESVLRKVQAWRRLAKVQQDFVAALPRAQADMANVERRLAAYEAEGGSGRPAQAAMTAQQLGPGTDDTIVRAYHGTAERFDEFEVGKTVQRGLLFGTYDVQSSGIFFSTDPEHAREWGPVVLECDVTLRNPFWDPEVDGDWPVGRKEECLLAMLRAISKEGETFDGKSVRYVDLGAFSYDETQWGNFNHFVDRNGLNWSLLDEPAAVQKMAEYGYDGTYVAESDGWSSIFVMSPAQVRILGEYRPDNADANQRPDGEPHTAAAYVVDDGKVQQGIARYEDRDRSEDQHLFETGGAWQSKTYEQVPIAAIRPRAVWNPSRYERARQALEQGIPLPPLDLSADDAGGLFTIEDGIHRYNAAKDLGIETVPAFVYRTETTAPHTAGRDDQSGDEMLTIAQRQEGGETSRDADGNLRWGRRAAGLLIVRGDGRVFLALRSEDVLDPGCWGIPGGRVEPGESDWSAAISETQEELGSLPPVHKLSEHVYRSGDFTYTTYVVAMDEQDAEGFTPRLNWENDDWGWFSREDPPSPLHPGVEAVLGGMGKTAQRYGEDYAYHATSIENLDSIRRLGLIPQRQPECHDDEKRCTDDEVIFFSSKERHAASWGGVILRFPWPLDATQDAYGEGYIDEGGGYRYTNWYTESPVSADQIDVQLPDGSWEWLPDLPDDAMTRTAEAPSSAVNEIIRQVVDRTRPPPSSVRMSVGMSEEDVREFLAEPRIAPLLELVAEAEGQAETPGCLRLYRAVDMGAIRPETAQGYERPYTFGEWSHEDQRWVEHVVPRGVGEAWSATPYGAYPYGTSKRSVEPRALVADVPFESVDWWVTIELVQTGGWDRESEIRLRAGAPLTLLGWWELEPRADRDKTWGEERSGTFVPLRMPVTAAVTANEQDSACAAVSILTAGDVVDMDEARGRLRPPPPEPEEAEAGGESTSDLADRILDLTKLMYGAPLETVTPFEIPPDLRHRVETRFGEWHGPGPDPDVQGWRHDSVIVRMPKMPQSRYYRDGAAVTVGTILTYLNKDGSLSSYTWIGQLGSGWDRFKRLCDGIDIGGLVDAFNRDHADYPDRQIPRIQGVPSRAGLADGSDPRALTAMPAAGSTLYHGCSADAARAIAAAGYVRAGDRNRWGKAMQPMQGRTYWTADPTYALHYVSGSWVPWPGAPEKYAPGKSAGLVLTDAAFTEAVPDEDWLGAQVREAFLRTGRGLPKESLETTIPDKPWLGPLWRALPASIKRKMGEVLDEMSAGDAVVGKLTNRWLIRTQRQQGLLQQLVEAAPNLAMPSEIPVTAVFIFDPYYLRQDFSNLWDIAESLPIGGGAATADSGEMPRSAAVPAGEVNDLVKVWHVTPARVVSKIMREGLIPRRGKRSRAMGERGDAIFVFSDWTAMDDALANWLGDEFEDVRLSVLELNVPHSWIEPGGAGFESVITRPVPPEMIRVLVPDVDEWDGSHPDGDAGMPTTAETEDIRMPDRHDQQPMSTHVDITDAHRGELFGQVSATQDGRPVGLLDFSVVEDWVYEVVDDQGNVLLETTSPHEAEVRASDDLEGYPDDPPPHPVRERQRKTVHVKWIEVDPAARRQGIGRAMVDALRRQFPDHQIDTGYVTDEGAGAFWDSALREAAEPVHRDAALSASEAVYGALSWLTTLDEPVTFGASEDAAAAAELAQMFIDANDLPELRDRWTDALVHPQVDGSSA